MVRKEWQIDGQVAHLNGGTGDSALSSTSYARGQRVGIVHRLTKARLLYGCHECPSPGQDPHQYTNDNPEIVGGREPAIACALRVQADGIDDSLRLEEQKKYGDRDHECHDIGIRPADLFGSEAIQNVGNDHQDDQDGRIELHIPGPKYLLLGSPELDVREQRAHKENSKHRARYGPQILSGTLAIVVPISVKPANLV